MNFLSNILGGAAHAVGSVNNALQQALYPNTMATRDALDKQYGFAPGTIATPQIEALHTRNVDAINQGQENRAQTEFDTKRNTQVTLGALSAASNMFDSIENSDLPEADRPQARAAAFDRIAPALHAAGYDPAVIDQFRAQSIENPKAVGDLLAGLQDGLAGTGGSRQGLQAAFDANGRAVFIDPRTGRPAARGFAPATAVLGDRRVGISQTNAETAQGRLEQQTIQNDPNHAFDVSSAQSEGTQAGQNAAREPEALAAGTEVVRRIDTILDTPPDQLASVLGMPSLGGALAGGFGQYGAWPGSDRADIQGDIGALSSSMRNAAYQLVLKGGGSITEAESQFGADAFVNLARSQSPGKFRDNLVHAREYFQGLLQRYQSQASPTRNPNRQGSTRTTAPASTTAAPAAAAAPAFNVDDYLAQRGH